MRVFARCVLPALGLAVLCGPAFATKTTAGSNGIVLKSDDGRSELEIGGRLHYDFVRFNNDLTPFRDDDGLRRLRLTLSGKVAEDWRFRIERDVGGTSKGWKNVWLGYDGIKHWDFRVGNMIAPLGMEQQLGSNDIPLMERSLASALSPGFLTGLQARYDRRGWTAAVGYFWSPLDQELGSSGSDGHGPVGRVTYAPLRGKGRVLHFGASFEDRTLSNAYDPITNPGGGFRIRSRPGAGLTKLALIDTGVMVDVKGTKTWGLEAGSILGPVSLLAERVQMSVDRNAAPSVDFSGWHVTGAWVITGESRRYYSGSGTFGDVKPQHAWGAVELATRYDTLDLQDAGISGGRERNFAYGVNWYLGNNFRLMLNHVRAKAEPNRNGLPESMSINEVRAQVDF